MAGAIAAKFEDDQIEELLERTAKGETLMSIDQDPRMPKRRTVYDWLDKDGERFWPEFAARFHDARARGVHALAEECLEIADEVVRDPVAVANKRVRIDTRLRLAGKWLPRIYGDSTMLKHADADGEKLPIELDPVARATRLAALAAEIEKRGHADAD